MVLPARRASIITRAPAAMASTLRVSLMKRCRKSRESLSVSTMCCFTGYLPFLNDGNELRWRACLRKSCALFTKLPGGCNRIPPVPPEAALRQANTNRALPTLVLVEIHQSQHASDSGFGIAPSDDVGGAAILLHI